MLPFVVRYQMAAMVSLGNSTIEASRASGAGAFRTLVLVVLPLCKRNLAAAAAIIFILLSHEFGVSVLLKGPETTVLSVMLFERNAAGSYTTVAANALVMTVITGLGVVAALMAGGRKALERL
jgi:iron(III) transport system permease protein